MGASTASTETECSTDTELSAVEWNALADGVKADPFVRPGWIKAWHGAFGRGRLELWALRRAGRLVAAIPLERVAGVLRSPTNWHTPSFGVLAVDAQARRELLAGLYNRASHMVDLGFVGPEIADEAACAARERGWRVLSRLTDQAPYVDTTGDWQAYEAALGKRTRNNVHRGWRRLRECGQVDFSIYTGGPELAERLEAAFRVEALGWKGENGTAIASNPHTLRFYTEIANWAADAGWLRLGLLSLDGRLIASDLTLESFGVCYALKAGYDPEFSRFGPSHLLCHAMLERSFHRDVHRFDLLGGHIEYKRRWSKQCRQEHRVQAFSRTPVGLAGWAAFAYGRPMVKQVAQARSARRRDR